MLKLIDHANATTMFVSTAQQYQKCKYPNLYRKYTISGRKNRQQVGIEVYLIVPAALVTT